MSARKRKDAIRYHKNLPPQVWFMLREYGILDSLTYGRLLGWHEDRLTVPVFSRNGDIACFEFYEVTDDGFRLDSSRTRSCWEIYGWDTLLLKPRQVILCEGSLERLVLGSHAFNVVSISGYERSVKAMWLPFFRDIAEVFICFKRSEMGALASETLGRQLRNARVVELPVSDGGGVHEFFVTGGKSRADFLDLLATASYED